MTAKGQGVRGGLTLRKRRDPSKMGRGGKSPANKRFLKGHRGDPSPMTLRGSAAEAFSLQTSGFRGPDEGSGHPKGYDPLTLRKLRSSASGHRPVGPMTPWQSDKDPPTKSPTPRPPV